MLSISVRPVLLIQVSHQLGPYYYYYQAVGEGHHTITKFRRTLMVKMTVLALIAMVFVPLVSMAFVANEAMQYAQAGASPQEMSFQAIYLTYLISMFVKIVIGYGLGNIIYYLFEVQNIYRRLLNWIYRSLGAPSDYVPDGRRVFRAYFFYPENIAMLLIGLSISFFFPIILPFLFVYHVLRYSLDRYNVMIGARPSHSFDNREFHFVKKMIIAIIAAFQVYAAVVLVEPVDLVNGSPLSIIVSVSVILANALSIGLYGYRYFAGKISRRVRKYRQRRLHNELAPNETTEASVKRELANSTFVQLFAENVPTSVLRRAYLPPKSDATSKDINEPLLYTLYI